MMTQRHNKIILLSLLALSACAPYSANTAGIRNSLSSGDHTGALAAIEKAAHGPSKLLYFLESGLVAHYDGQYVRSNNLLDRAERIADELFTRSLSRELASLITSDESRHYRGEPYELVFIHYYRALNYWYLHLPEDALVECRKANLKLARYESDDDRQRAYRNDAFIHYLTALFYESEREYNDAYVSLKDAEIAYAVYGEIFDLEAPESLISDLARVESELGYAGAVPSLAHLAPRSRSGELVVFTELGFVPRKTQEEVNLPIYESDLKRVRSGKARRTSRQIRQRHYHRRHKNVDYWLRVALPQLEPVQNHRERILISSGGYQTVPEKAQDLDRIARRTLEDNEGSIFVRTVARGLIKLAATKGAEKKSEWFGFLVNLFTAATEKADTRSWVTLPREIRIGRLILPPGEHTITIQSRDSYGIIIEAKERTVTIEAGKRTFINQRLYG
jgi:uncharacterized protein